MHGLVCIDKNNKPVRNSIIWCDSRAVEIGNKAFKSLGEDYCLTNYLNSPGNFTASKLKWVKDNEPEVFGRVHKVLLPGDYIALKLTGEAVTTISGLSEGIMWNYSKNKVATELLEEYGINSSVVSNVVNTFSEQGKLSVSAAETLGLKAGTPVSYRAGDQPNPAVEHALKGEKDRRGVGSQRSTVLACVGHCTSDERRPKSHEYARHNAGDHALA